MKKNIEKINNFVRRIKKEVSLYQRVLNDERTPLAAKILLWLAISYLLMPFDLIPDFIPVLGQLDDLIIVPGLVYTAVLLIPKNIISEHRYNLDKVTK